MLILICDAFDASLPKRLEVFGTVTSDISKLPEADVALVRSKTKCTAEWIAKAPRLKMIIRGGVGLDNVDKAAAQARGIIVKNTPRASSVAVAELAFALMLSVPNRLIEAHNAMKEGKFLKSELKRTELMGKTLGLIGNGLIAQEVAKRAQAFGMKVLAYDPYAKPNAYSTLVPNLKEMLGQSDYVSIHVPLTDETRGMINEDTLSATKKGAVIINTGRGKCVVESDLTEALKSGHIAHYATDVFLSDPPPADSPLLTAPNTTMTPHLGASTKENLLRIGNEVVTLLEEFKKSN